MEVRQRLLVRAGSWCAAGWLLGLAALCPAQEAPEQRMLAVTNADRAEQGLSPLVWNPALAAAARLHAQRMEAADLLSHQLPGEADLATRTASTGAHFRAIAENIAQGYDPVAIERAWMASTGHRTNILDSRMNAIGIALVHANGVLWAVEDFAAEVPLVEPGTVEEDVARELRTYGVATASPGSVNQAAARAACPQFEGPGGMGARFVVRWESADPTQLPEPLRDALKSGKYTRAAVGACASTNPRNRDFTAYRVAVLLF